MNAQEKLAAQISIEQTAIKTVRPEIGWVFTGETYVDAKGRMWHEATANGQRVWARYNGERVVSEYDPIDIEHNTKHEGREATLEEVTATLAKEGMLTSFTYSGRSYELKRNDSEHVVVVHKLYDNGAVAYVRGFKGRDNRIALSIGNELDFFI
ncbi:hypothetical protein SEA_EASTWEST_81 [Arthrobacter phage EastWest]|uniref:Uncharacterized protein n=1 Tax=Arthrobacter phage EastWest TaxID=2894292 RepID=A0AAE9C985_9CAUD|nr:hypothetical protein SEA_EASTWEST_81 [Arthrobacter phage EastWest]